MSTTRGASSTIVSQETRRRTASIDSTDLKSSSVLDSLGRSTESYENFKMISTRDCITWITTLHDHGVNLIQNKSGYISNLNPEYEYKVITQ